MIYILLGLILVLQTLLLILLYKQTENRKRHVLMQKDLIEINNILDEHFKRNNDLLLSKISFNKHTSDVNLFDTGFIKCIEECSIIQKDSMEQIYRLNMQQGSIDIKSSIESIIKNTDILNIKLKEMKDLYIMFR